MLAEDKQQLLPGEIVGQPRCLGDRLVLRHALINLVDNAIKYTPAQGRIVVRASEVGPAAVIDVCDSGTGIPAEFRARLFDRRSRASRSSAGTRGSGLGLSIAKWSVEACGGRSSLENIRESGSTFRMTLPGVREPRLTATG